MAESLGPNYFRNALTYTLRGVLPWSPRQFYIQGRCLSRWTRALIDVVASTILSDTPFPTSTPSQALCILVSAVTWLISSLLMYWCDHHLRFRRFGFLYVCLFTATIKASMFLPWDFPLFFLTLSYFPPSPRTIRQTAYFPCSSASCLSLLGGQSLSLTVNSLLWRWCSAHHRHSGCICWLAEGMREWKHNCTDV